MGAQKSQKVSESHKRCQEPFPQKIAETVPDTFVCFRNQLDRNADFVTMSCAVGKNREGNRVVLVSTSEASRYYLRRGVRLEPGDIFVIGDSHAEANIANYAVSKGIVLVDIGATRPVCPTCELQIPNQSRKQAENRQTENRYQSP